MEGFEFENKVKLYFGSGKINELGKLCKGLGSKPMVVTTHSLDDETGFGKVLKRVLSILKDSGIQPVVYDRAVLNPTTTSVDEGARIAIDNNVDYIIGVGGGSAVDTAKAIAVAAKTKRPIWDFLSGKDHETEDITEALPIAAVDTTAGSATSITMFFVITNPKTNEKPGGGGVITWPTFSIVDPELMLGIPKDVTAVTGLDAFYHSFEGYVSNVANPISDMYSSRSIELVAKYLPIAYNQGSNLEAREKMALASVFAGYSLTGALAVLLHAMAHSVGGFTNIAHGLALSSLLEPWLEFTYPRSPKRVADIIKIFGTDISGMAGEEAAGTAVKVLSDFKSSIGVDMTLKKTGLPESAFETVAADTFATMQGCVDCQPGDPVTTEDIIMILKKAYQV